MNGSAVLILTTAVSGALHLSVGGGLYSFFTRSDRAPIVAELDLSLTPLAPAIPNAGGGRGKPKEAWVAPAKKQLPPAPAAPEQIETKEEVRKQEAQDGPCVDCSETGTGDGGGGSGMGEGQYIPVEAAAKKPRWIRNFITSRDYPLIARQQGKDGRVVLTVLIDSEGRVRDARLLEGGYEALNEVALRKVMEARFTPAYDAGGQPVSCKVTLPIRFELH